MLSPADQPAGYAHPGYASSLGEFGTPLHLPRSGGHLLRRPIATSGRHDAMAPYPLLACLDWGGLASDLSGLSGDLVSVTAVTDPLGDYDEDTLREAFPDLVQRYKEHFVVDLTGDWRGAIGPHHRRNIAAAQDRVSVTHSSAPEDWLAEWIELYGNLAARHRIEGPARFSRHAFESQFALPGVHLFRADRGGAAAGMLMWFAQGSRAWYHLGCYSEEGYRAGASFALFRYAIEWFENVGLATLVLGAGAGVANDGSEGLNRFKRGWATGTRAAWLCGRVLDRPAYDRLSRGASGEGYFPAYRRWGERGAETLAG